ncbi:MAG: SDR family oxidoreductase [Pyrinomonadaceae bacterium]|nr:SDR family oxidoreductase [Pyrinomonadaceae bacterium]
MAEFDAKVAIVTGGTSGIGTATAEAFAAKGAKVTVSGRREDKGNSVVESIRKAGGEAIFVKTDIQKSGDVKKMVEKTIDAFGRLDFAVNNAGVEQYFKPLPEQTEDIYSMIMDTNVKGVWMSMKEEIPAMLKTGGGTVVNMSSIAGVVGMANAPIYSASKHAVIGLTKSIALEFAQQNIRVNAILPAAIETPMIDRFTQGQEEAFKYFESLHPVGRVGKPQEVADACIWLCSEKSSFVTGSSIRVDGGFTAQ